MASKPEITRIQTKISGQEPEGLSLDDTIRYRDLFDQTPVGILEENYSIAKRIIDSLGAESGAQLREFLSNDPKLVFKIISSVRITDINAAALRAYGTDSKDEFIQDQYDFDSWWESEWTDFYIDELVALYDQLLPFEREFTDYSFEQDSSFQDKELVIRNVTRIVAGCEDNWSRVISTVEDITDRKKMEAQLHQAQKMEAIGQLTGGLAHDVNNILAIISGNAEILEERMKGSDQHIQEIFHAVNSGSSLVKQLLSFSRKHHLDSRAVDVNELITNLSRLLTRTLGESIDISVDLANGIWPVETDPSRLENALLNLVLNSRDAMPSGGKLTIQTSNESIEKPFITNNHHITAGEYVVLSVIDNGCGMSSEELAQVFEPFYTTKDVGQGSGLGLSSVYGFVKQTGGHATIFSTENIGTEVRIYLPRSEDTPGFLFIQPPEETPQSHGETILVLEDEKILCELVSSMLTDLGYKVLVARNGLEALDVLKNNEIVDLLLSDIGLPGRMSGVDVAEQASKYQPAIKFQFMSGYVQDLYKQYPDIAKYGAVLDKPFRKSQLAQKIRSVLESQPA
jgi:signal transduction histidine kinase/CheY-like chemotaxis protein